jgi:hypothetical protein
VFTAQANCHPDSVLAEAFAEHQTVPSYLNSGGFIGYVWGIREAYREIATVNASQYPRSNQYRWQLVAIKRRDLIEMDVRRTMFTCVGRPTDKREGDSSLIVRK